MKNALLSFCPAFILVLSFCLKNGLNGLAAKEDNKFKLEQIDSNRLNLDRGCTVFNPTLAERANA